MFYNGISMKTRCGRYQLNIFALGQGGQNCGAAGSTIKAVTTGVSSCPMTTVTDVVLSCVSASGSTRSCTTLGTSMVSGCSVTATTTTSYSECSGSSVPNMTASAMFGSTPACNTTATYVVYPSNGTDSSETEAIMQQLATIVDSSNITELDASGYGVVYWTLPLTAEQASQVAAFANVGLSDIISKSDNDLNFYPLV
jgi:hypothetical protein